MTFLRECCLVVFLLTAFFCANFQCKSFLDRAPELEFRKKFMEQSMEELLARFVLLDQKMALSQYYLLRMITYFNALNLPPDHAHEAEEGAEGKTGKEGVESHAHDSVDAMARIASQKYRLAHMDEFFDIDQYYALMGLVLKFDPHNEFARFFGLGFSINAPMTRGMCSVLERAFSQNPQWSVAYDCGWLYFYILREYDKARLWLQRAKSFAAAPPMVQGIYDATFLLDKKYDIAIQNSIQQIQNSTNPMLIPSLERRLHWYEALSLLYQKAVQYQERFGKSVSDLSDLVKTGLLASIPEDQLGGGFYWDAKNQEPASRNTYDLRKTSFPWESGELFEHNGAEHDSLEEHSHEHVHE